MAEEAAGVAGGLYPYLLFDHCVFPVVGRVVGHIIRQPRQHNNDVAPLRRFGGDCRRAVALPHWADAAAGNDDNI
jgi:hypothetical protein